MSLFSKLFGRAKPEPEPETHNGYRIYPEPMKESGGYRIAARIETGEGDSLQTHKMVRADTCGSLEEAQSFSVIKARLLIDQQGEDIFR
jgi:hypothetical protein